MASQSRLHDVLAIPELLEAILLELDINTLLVSALRVSRSWNQLISSSPSLQRALYFEPVRVDCDVGTLEKTSALNQSKWDDTIPTVEAARRRPVLNPLLVEKFGCCFFDLGQTYGYFRLADSFNNLPWATRPGGKWGKRPDLDDSKWAHFTRRGASWRRMLVSQPPPVELGYLLHENTTEAIFGHVIEAALYQPDAAPPMPRSPGLRMGDFYDILQHQAVHNDPDHLVWFRVLWNKLPGWFETQLAQITCKELLARTFVVLEIAQPWERNKPSRQPVDESTFDALYRCEEFREHEVRTEKKKAAPNGLHHNAWQIGGCVDSDDC